MIVQNEIQEQDLKNYIKLSPKQKLEQLEDLNNFFAKVMPKQNKEILSQLKKQGF